MACVLSEAHLGSLEITKQQAQPRFPTPTTHKQTLCTSTHPINTTSNTPQQPHQPHLVGAHLWRVSLHAAQVALGDLLERPIQRCQLPQLQLLVLIVRVVRGRAQLLNHRRRLVNLCGLRVCVGGGEGGGRVGYRMCECVSQLCGRECEQSANVDSTTGGAVQRESTH